MNNSITEIRDSWINLFVKNGYHFLSPASLIPKNDPSLLWINSGVAALKDYFNNSDLAPAKNLVNCQPVIRTNDIDRIDANSYHQTLFEMLGCFSIGGNFKQEVIPLIWNYFTNSEFLAIDASRLFITVLEDDHETYEIWRKQNGILLENIIKGSKQTNFWDMGDGPCGPNTEIYYSFDESRNNNISLRDLDSKAFIEIINIVFSEFYHRGNEYIPLSQKCVDVGAGLERIALVSQNVKNTFQIDVWKSSIDYLSKCCSEQIVNEKWKLYVIVDHLRTAIFAISNGALSSHNRHGYILKKLLKRSCLFSYILEISNQQLIEVCEEIIKSNAEFYSILIVKKTIIIDYLKNQLDKFNLSFQKSLKEIINYLKEFSNDEISAEKVFFWYDTKGIPLEIINFSLAKENKFFNQNTFNSLLSQQKKRSLINREKTNVFKQEKK